LSPEKKYVKYLRGKEAIETGIKKHFTTPE
jgi:hypothetical protein